jgi:hypothetical protein
MSAVLEFKQIPGFADALRREASVRREAWAHTHTEIAGVRVRMLTMRDVVMLEELQNGFFAPWRFDTDEEFLAHCAQMVWWLSDLPKPPLYSRSIFHPWIAGRQQALIRYLAGRPKQLAEDTNRFLRDSFMDAPKGGGTMGQAVAAMPAYLADTLAAAGFQITTDDMLDMPLTRLWQMVRLASRRVYGTAITNESDKLACDYLAGLNGRN